jgi:hypothetical protein
MINQNEKRLWPGVVELKTQWIKKYDLMFKALSWSEAEENVAVLQVLVSVGSNIMWESAQKRVVQNSRFLKIHHTLTLKQKTKKLKTKHNWGVKQC